MMTVKDKILALLLALAFNAFAAAWTGSSSEPENMKKIDGKPFYVITSADELAWFAAQVNAGNASINAVLGNDIVFGADSSTSSTVNWNPIGKDSSCIFNGVLDGSGKTIYGMKISNNKFLGLIGILGSSGVVRNLKMKNGARYSSNQVRWASGIVALNHGKISNCTNEDVIDFSLNDGSEDFENVGAIAGENKGIVELCVNNGNIDITEKGSNLTHSQYFGGIAGRNYGEIHYAVNNAVLKFTATWGVAEGPDSYLGGITGSNYGNVAMCVNYGEIQAKDHLGWMVTGGISGLNSNRLENSANYASISVKRKINSTAREIQQTGGIVGRNNVATGYRSPEIINCFNFGEEIISTYYNSNKEGFAGGVAGYNDGRLENCFFNASVLTGINTVGGGPDGSSRRVEINVSGMTASDMQKDQFAWILNTTNGTVENSGVWTRGSEGCPTFANEDSLAIRKIVFNDDGVTSNRYTNYKGIVSFPEDPEPAEGLVFSGWFNADDIRVKPTTVFVADQTVNAVYVDASNVFWTINFYNAVPADTLLESKSYQHGSIVTYGGETPTKEQTAQYSYTFKGWDVDPTNAVEDFDYHAVYDSIIRSYMIVFNNYDGTEIESGTYEYGKTPACNLTPTRAATAEWTYSHKGWNPAVDVVTGPATYTATFDSSKVEYKVTFMNGTAVIDEQMVPYGDAAVAPTNVSREGYKFVGWNISFAKVTENLTVKALFEELPTYFVKIIDDGGVKIDSVNIKEGGVYFLPEPETREGYAFAGYFDEGMGFILAGEGITVTADVVITAFYAEIPKSSSSSTPKSSSSSIRSSSSAKSSSSSAKSSSSVRSSSSNSKLSSSSAKTSIAMQNSIPKFRVSVNSRSIQLSGAEVGTAYVLLDMQGRVLQKGRVESANFNIAVPNAGQYFVKVSNQVRNVRVK